MTDSQTSSSASEAQTSVLVQGAEDPKVTEAVQTAPADQSNQSETDAADANHADAAGTPPGTKAEKARRRRGGRGRRDAAGSVAPEQQRTQTPQPQQQQPRSRARAGSAEGRRPPPSHPLLTRLGEAYPLLFGEHPQPLKRGIFQDIAAAHPDWAAEELKEALGLHTRSTRYLVAVAAGQARHDLAGQTVEAMAPEHVHHALLEVFKRRQQRTQEDLTPKLRHRLAQAFEASGLSRDDYALQMRHRDERYNQLLDEALSEVAQATARDEALLRAFESAGAQDVESFASMYGRDPRQVQRAISNARRRREAAEKAAASK